MTNLSYMDIVTREIEHRKMKCVECQSDNPANTKFCGNCGAPLSPSQEIPLEYTRTIVTDTKEIAIGAVFAGRYYIIEDLGKGGMGHVYKALDSRINEKVALKVLNPEIAADEQTLERFQNELKLTRKISHRHICRLHDIGEDEGLHYITMEYVSGEDLKSLIRRIGQFTVGKAVFIARQACEGLTEAHRLGVVHRDLKPQNIMIDQEGNTRVMDFGIARSLQKRGMTDTGVIVGTPEYMSPEQVEGKTIDQRSDIYSLGIILYEMLTGKVPFEGETPLSVAVKQKTEKPRDPKRLNRQIPDEISRLILKCLEKDKTLRYQSTEELLADLSLIESKIPSTDRVYPEKKTRTSKQITVQFNIKKILYPLVGLAATVLLIFLGLKLFSREGSGISATGKPALAVMHFENNTGDESLDNWRKALSDLLIADLSQSKFFNVISPEKLYDILEEMNLLNAKSYSSTSLEEIARKGGVNYVLVGKMTQAGNVIRLNTSLLEMSTGNTLGSEQVEGEGEDSLFDLVDQLTTKIKEKFNLSAKDIASDLDQDIRDITSSHPEALRYFQEGMHYQNRADYTKSIPLMELAVAIDPEFAMAYRSLAVAYSNLGYNSEAKIHLQKAFDLSEKVSERERYYILGDYYRNSENSQDKAIEAYTKLLELYGDDTIGNNNLGILYMSQEQWDKAIKHFEINTQNHINNYFSYSNLANVYISKGEFEQALKVLEGYLNDVSEHPRIYGGLANIHLLQGKYDLAVTEADKAFALSPDFFEHHYIKGSAYFLQGDLVRAEAEYQNLLKTDQPAAHYMANNSLSTLYLAQGKFAAAQLQLEQGIDLAEMLGEKDWELNLHFNQALIYLTSGENEEAWQSWQKADAIVAEMDSPFRKKGVLFIKGLVLLSKGSLDEVQKVTEELRALISAGSNRKEARYNRYLVGRLNMERGQFSEAVRNLNMAIRMLPAKDSLHAMFAETRARAVYMSGDLEQALKEYQAILQQVAPSPEYVYYQVISHYMLGKIYQELGRNAEAKGSYQEFLVRWQNADPNIPEVVDARKQLASL